MFRAFTSAILLPVFFFVVLFLATPFIDLPNLSSAFWAALAGALLLFFYASVRNLHSVAYYALFLTYTAFFGYLIQSSIGVSYFLNRNSVDSFDFDALAIFTVNFLGIALGSEILLSIRRRGAGLSQNMPPASRIPSVYTLPSLLALLALSGAIAFILFGTSGFLDTRFDQFIASRSGGDGDRQSGYLQFIFQALKFLPYVVSVALLAGFFKAGRSAGLFLLAFLPVLIYTLGISNPVNTARYVSLTALSLIFLTWLSMKCRTAWLPTIIAALPAALIVILPFTSYLRHGTEIASPTEVLPLYSSLEFSTAQLVISGSKTTTESDGLYTLSGLLIFLPRALWEGKAESLGAAIAENSGFVFLNAAVPSFFAAFQDGGYLALLLFSTLSGLILAWGQIRDEMDWFRRRDFYRMAVFSLTPIFARGDFSTCAISFYALAIAYETTRVFARLSWRAVDPV